MTLELAEKAQSLMNESKLKKWKGIVDDALKADHVITEPAFRFMWGQLFGKHPFKDTEQ